MDANTAVADEPAQPQTAGTPDQPVSAGDRIVTLDFIRGIAVLAIIFPNVVAFGYPLLAYYWPEALDGGSTAADRYFWLFQYVLIDGKFRGLFTLLFGAGMMLFMERAWARGGTRRVQARRLGWLGLFGLAHYFLLWTGDILFLYAFAGFVALPMLTWRARTQLRVGIAWFLAGGLLFSVILGGQAAMEGIPLVQAQQPEAYQELKTEIDRQVSDAAKEAAVFETGSFGEVVAFRLAEQASDLGVIPFFALLETVPLMLIGMALYRMGLFEGRFDPVRIRRWGWIGFVGGAVLSLPLGLWALSAGFPMMLTQFVFNGPSAFMHLPMALGLAALLSLWAPSASQTWIGSRFVAAGRMAFSNYLGTSLLMMLVFQAWAGGLYGELHRPQLLLAVLGVWLLMLAWSKPWLERFRYGPLEWLWRCLTYGKLFPLRR
jgi:uncharacterized protein